MAFRCSRETRDRIDAVTKRLERGGAPLGKGDKGTFLERLLVLGLLNVEAAPSDANAGNRVGAVGTGAGVRWVYPWGDPPKRAGASPASPKRANRPEPRKPAAKPAAGRKQAPAKRKK